MLISRNWLQSYFEIELPSVEKIADDLMLHAFEIEGIENTEFDSIIDIDVLPNRAHDCLSHVGIAREYAALTHRAIKSDRYHYHESVTYVNDGPIVDIENTQQCFRYTARQINNIKVEKSPTWLQDRLKAISQRSINNIVDATNYVMFDLGQPMHAFDADKVVGVITIRNAKSNEEMITLTGEELVLDESDLVITDDEGILALAGVKGGMKAQVDEHTKNIIIEVANFNPLTTRQTSRRVKILTDSSKRFENAISSELAMTAMENISMLISDIAYTDTTSLSSITDQYSKKEKSRSIEVTLAHIQSLLGIPLAPNDIVDIFDRLDYQHHLKEEIFEVHVPYNRLDLNIAEDVIEEIGRVYGYHNIPAKNLDDYNFNPEINSQVYVEQTLRNLLVKNNFSDVMTYSFVKKGDIEMFNPIASDKKALRKNLHQQLQESLEKNIHNSDYFGVDRIAIFEIGRVYTKDSEKILCSIAIHNTNKSAKKKYGTEQIQFELLCEEINSIFHVKIIPEYHGNIMSFDVHGLVDKNTENEYGDIFKELSYEEEDRFNTISPYPFMKRDVSFWAPEGKLENELRSLLSGSNTKYLKKIFLFDQFEKEGRISYAFSLVFQSNEKTLTDSDVDNDMKKIEDLLINIGCDIR